MELLLNLFWLLLVVPALLLSRQAKRSARESGQICRTNSSVVVVCLMLLLFPVVSATDDLLALGLDMEESSATKSLVKHSVSPKTPALGNDTVKPAQLYSFASYAPDQELYKAVQIYAVVLPQYDPASASGCRAPPCSDSSALVAPSQMARIPIVKLDFILQSHAVKAMGSQAGPPQASVAPDGLRSFECRTHLLTASGSFPVVSRSRTQPPRPPTFQVLREDEV